MAKAAVTPALAYWVAVMVKGAAVPFWVMLVIFATLVAKSAMFSAMLAAVSLTDTEATLVLAIKACT